MAVDNIEQWIAKYPRFPSFIKEEITEEGRTIYSITTTVRVLFNNEWWLILVGERSSRMEWDELLYYFLVNVETTRYNDKTIHEKDGQFNMYINKDPNQDLEITRLRKLSFR